MPREGAPDLLDGPVAVVGKGVDQDGDSVRPVAFEDHFGQGAALDLTGALLDGPVNVIHGHVGVPGFLNRQAEAKVSLGVTAAFPRGDDELTRQLGEKQPAFGIGDALLVLYRMPFRMT